MRRRGFTLVELLIVMTITGILATAVLHLLADTREAARSTARHQRWSGEAQAAFALLGRDARAAMTVAPADQALRLDGPAGPVQWRREAVEGVPALVREAGQRRQVVATDVEGLRVVQAGRRLTVELVFLAEDGAHRATTTHATTIALYGEGP
ncbi:MAG: prepilin-type N-terminal cleavage/methylation domain-containing protein [Myxococcales bacterium]|nr:prepilin-type N-terminal cleavage/methylation domain-containing protein [Myxococcales bacterium]